MIYYDPSYVEHQSAWRKVGAKFMLGVGDSGDWREWLATPFPIVTTAHPVGIEFTSISPADGFGKTDGPLDTLVAAVERKQIEAMPDKTLRAEEQRREVGSQALDDSVLNVLKGADAGAQSPNLPEDAVIAEPEPPMPTSTKFLTRRKTSDKIREESEENDSDDN